MTIDFSKIPTRVAFLREVAFALMEDGVLPEAEFVLREGRIPLLANGYFLLNEAYKSWRIEDGHNTQPPKVAALLSMAVVTFQPFRPLDSRLAATPLQARCSEVYALACAKAAMGRAKNLEKTNFYMRVLDVLSEARSETLEPYIVDIEMSIDRPLESNRLFAHQNDKLPINSLVTIFESISDIYD